MCFLFKFFQTLVLYPNDVIDIIWGQCFGYQYLHIRTKGFDKFMVCDIVSGTCYSLHWKYVEAIDCGILKVVYCGTYNFKDTQVSRLVQFFCGHQQSGSSINTFQTISILLDGVDWFFTIFYCPSCRAFFLLTIGCMQFMNICNNWGSLPWICIP